MRQGAKHELQHGTAHRSQANDGHSFLLEPAAASPQQVRRLAMIVAVVSACPVVTG